MVFQPIVSLKNGQTLGWEALTRGPENGHFYSPSVLFSFAEEVGMLYPLEKVCRKKAITAIGRLDPGQKLFININPRTISDPSFVSGETLHYLELYGFEAGNIVFEITEQTDIKIFPNFSKTLKHYRNQGYQIAVDDVGAGFSSLSTIALIRPDFLKMDMSLVSNIHHDPVKKALMETFVAFAEKIGCIIIAEGIETESELDVLMDLGVHYGQGFLFARPISAKPEPDKRMTIRIFNNDIGGNRKFWRNTIPVRYIVEKCQTINKQIPIQSIKETFDKSPEMAGVVVVENKKPVGIVMKQNMYKELSTLYGMSLYKDKPAEKLMDNHPLVVDIETPIQKVSQVAMSRDNAKLYDYVVVTRQGEYAGIVSVQTLLDTLTRIQVDIARRANPLTGLPGNTIIEEEINNRLNNGGKFWLIYCDLDNFKSYNDKYGFEQGDKIILLTARILQYCLKKYGTKNDFVGHVGGDDFVIITQLNNAERICSRIIKIFDRLIPGRYRSDDRAKGGIAGMDRQGLNKWFPFVSISLAIVECYNTKNLTSQKIVHLSAELKKYAKSIEGSVFVKNRRNIAHL